MEFILEGEGKMNLKKLLIPILLLISTIFSFACVYVVLPEGLETSVPASEGHEVKAWNAVATNVGTSDAGDLHIDITIQNDTGDCEPSFSLLMDQAHHAEYSADSCWQNQHRKCDDSFSSI